MGGVSGTLRMCCAATESAVRAETLWPAESARFAFRSHIGDIEPRRIGLAPRALRPDRAAGPRPAVPELAECRGVLAKQQPARVDRRARTCPGPPARLSIQARGPSRASGGAALVRTAWRPRSSGAAGREASRADRGGQWQGHREKPDRADRRGSVTGGGLSVGASAPSHAASAGVWAGINCSGHA